MRENVRQATNQSALELLQNLLSAELDEAPRNAPLDRSRQLIAKRLQKLHEQRTKQMVFATAAAIGCPEKAQALYSNIVKMPRMIPTEGAIKGWMTKTDRRLRCIGLVEVKRYDRGRKQVDVIGEIVLTEMGREFMRQVERGAITLIVDVSAIGDEPNREGDEG